MFNEQGRHIGVSFLSAQMKRCKASFRISISFGSVFQKSSRYVHLKNWQTSAKLKVFYLIMQDYNFIIKKIKKTNFLSYLILTSCNVQRCMPIFGHCVWRCPLIQQKQSNILMIVVGCHVKRSYSVLQRVTVVL